MTHTFTKTPRDHSALDAATVTVTTESDNLMTLVDTFEDYLRACGYDIEYVTYVLRPSPVIHSD